MDNSPAWLPELVLLSKYDGQWQKYIDAVFAVFYKGFIESQPKFDGQWVRCRRDPMFDGKEAGFWHCVSDGPNEKDRTPDLRRCERIEWLRSMIDHADKCDVWPNYRTQEKRWCLWVNEEFIVILAERHRRRDGFKYMQLITAYCTEEKQRVRKLRKERDLYYDSING
ncbi:MAG: hypothetical protein KAS23_12135 [Anaerohalosphaera sp.]|nr:hypothetical protein [Anaerohalosphaera sp.]